MTQRHDRSEPDHDLDGGAYGRDRPAPGRCSLVQRLPARSAGARRPVDAPAAEPELSPAFQEARAAEVQRDLDEAHGFFHDAPVQRKEAGRGEDEPATVQVMAAEGMSGSGGPLPFFDTIQRSFGAHDVAGVQAYQDDNAGRAAQGIGATAYASGERVAFGAPPDLHTAAHEAAHVVQQRGGVSLPGGVGQAGDAHEVNADRVADAVVRGESAEALLAPYATSTSAEPAVQRKPGPPAPGAARGVGGEEAVPSSEAGVLTEAERVDLIDRTGSRLTFMLVEFGRALGQIDTDQIRRAATNKSLATSLLDLFFLIPLGAPIAVAWSNAGTVFSAPHLSGAAASLSTWLLQGARSKVSFTVQDDETKHRKILDEFARRAGQCHEHGTASLKSMTDLELVAAYLAYDQERTTVGRIRAGIEREIMLYLNVVETAGKVGSDFELVRVHSYTTTRPDPSNDWPLFMAQKFDDRLGYYVRDSVPDRWKGQAIEAHRRRFGLEPFLLVAIHPHGHSMPVGMWAKPVDTVFPARRPPRPIGPPTPTRRI